MSDSTITMVAVSSVAPSVTDKELATNKQIIISARRNKPKDGPELEAHERARFIIVPELSVPEIPSKFQMLVLDTLYRIARDQLDSIWKDDPQVKEVPQTLFSVDSLLLYAAKKNESGKLAGDNISIWFDSSTLRQRIGKMEQAKQPGAIKKYREEGFCKLAAPVIEFSEKECSDLLNLLNKEADQEATILKQMAARLRNRIATLQKQREMAFADDLPE